MDALIHLFIENPGLFMKKTYNSANPLMGKNLRDTVFVTPQWDVVVSLVRAASYLLDCYGCLRNNISHLWSLTSHDLDTGAELEAKKLCPTLAHPNLWVKNSKYSNIFK